MGIDLWGQAWVCLGSVLLGLGAGLVYDLMRVLRRTIPLKALGILLDFLFWVLLTVALFLYAIWAGDGRLRIYMIVALGLGGLAYFASLSRPTLFLCNKLTQLLGLLCSILSLPLKILGKLCKKIKENTKNIFHYRRRWYRIKGIPKEMNQSFQGRFQSSQTEVCHRGSKSRHSHKNCGVRSTDLPINLSAESTKPDC